MQDPAAGRERLNQRIDVYRVGSIGKAAEKILTGVPLEVQIAL